MPTSSLFNLKSPTAPSAKKAGGKKKAKEKKGHSEADATLAKPTIFKQAKGRKLTSHEMHQAMLKEIKSRLATQSTMPDVMSWLTRLTDAFISRIRHDKTYEPQVEESIANAITACVLALDQQFKDALERPSAVEIGPHMLQEMQKHLGTLPRSAQKLSALMFTESMSDLPDSQL